MSHSREWLDNTSLTTYFPSPRHSPNSQISHLVPNPFLRSGRTQPKTCSLGHSCCMSLGESLDLLGLLRGEEANPGDELNYVWIIHLTREET